MTYRWIISDIDGCLSPEGSHAWDWENFKLLLDFFNSRKRKDDKYPVPLILCTGRPQPYVEVWAKLLDLRAPLICENGAVIYYLLTNTSVFGPGVSLEKMEGLRKVRKYIEQNILSTYPEVVYQFGKEAQISLFSKNPSVFEEIKTKILNFVKEVDGPELVIQPSHYYLNISLAGVNKGEAIRMILNEIGISQEECVGIGDTLGDLPLRENVGFFACPSNAQREIKEIADYISPYPDVLGVLDILKLQEFQSIWECDRK